MQSIRTFPEAVQLLQDANIIIYPTETFFAVGCGIFEAHALEQVFASKKRPVNKPLPVLAANIEHVHSIAHLNAQELALAQAFWPGPLTLLCTAKACVPHSITAGTGKVAVRISSHSTARDLAKAIGAPLVCSSANLSGEAPPRWVKDISPVLLQTVQGLLVQGAQPQGGLPSTIVELCEQTLYIRRQGAISVQCLSSMAECIVQE